MPRVQYKDYYQIMGVARDASAAHIKQAYRRLARKYHPDVSKEKDAEARFKDLGEAYEVLKDPEKRAAYDRLGKGPRPGEEFRPPPDWNAGFEFSGPGAGADLGGFSDFFESLFGRAGGMPGGRGAPRHGADQHARVLLDLDASLQGGARSLTLEDRTLSVQIPKGILAGQHIRLAGQGYDGAAGDKKGDLFIEVGFQPHPLYRVDGRDLALTLPVAPWEASLGATIKMPTPGGQVDLKIPAGSHAGSKLRLKGRGIPSSPAGDLYVVLEISLPPAADAKSRAAYSAFAAACPFNPRAQLGV
jgi:curved DNA-binding protein